MEERKITWEDYSHVYGSHLLSHEEWKRLIKLLEQEPGYEEITRSMTSIHINRNYVSGGPGYCGIQIIMAWDGSPHFISVVTGHPDGKWTVVHLSEEGHRYIEY